MRAVLGKHPYILPILPMIIIFDAFNIQVALETYVGTFSDQIE